MDQLSKKRISWLCIVLQLSTLLLPSTMAVADMVPRQGLFQSKTGLYTLHDGENIDSVAKKFSVSVDELKLANQFRSLNKPIEHIGRCDQINIPLGDIQRAKTEGKLGLLLDQSCTALESDDAASKTANAATLLANVLKTANPARSAADQAKGMARSALGSSVEEWFSPFGTARVKLNLDDALDLEGSEFDLLYPWYDIPSSMIFSQTGIRRIDHRTTLNLGLGQRHYMAQQMFGYNAFFDYDLTRSHYRMGLGAEYGRDYFKLGANSYIGLSGWRAAPDVEDYLAKPANGFDVRAEAWLPAYPQWGGKLMFEQYFGDEVALFGKDQRQKDPAALTAGLNYTPFPLLSLGVEHKQGSSSNNDTRIGLDFNYQLGVPWQQQISQAAVAQRRTLQGSRYDLIERNNQIVLQYKKLETINLVMPSSLEGQSGETVALALNIEAKHGVSNIIFDDTALLMAGGKINSQNNAYTITLPAYNAGEDNAYVISAVAQDNKGNHSKRTYTTLRVTMTDTPQITAMVDKDNAVANNLDTNLLTFTFNDVANNPLVGQVVAVSSEDATLVRSKKSSEPYTTNQVGAVQVAVSNLRAGKATVSATLGNSTHTGNVNFIADSNSALLVTGSLQVIRDGAKADGVDTNKVQVQVSDSSGNLLSGENVQFSADNGVQLSADSVASDAQGNVSVTLTNTLAGVSNVSAQLNNSKLSVATHFVADDGSATLKDGDLTVLRDNALADGSATNEVQARVTDANGNPVAGVNVMFSVDHSANLSVANGVSTGDGTVRVTLTNMLAGVSTVSAEVNGVSRSVATHFTANSQTAMLAPGSLSVIQDGAVANALAQNEIEALVTDAGGNPLADQRVRLQASNGAVIASGVLSDINGRISATLQSTIAGPTEIVAEINNSRQQVTSRFIADVSTAELQAANLSVIQDGAVADGVEQNVVALTVVDANNNRVPKVVVDFTTDNGATIIASKETNDDGSLNVSVSHTVAGETTVTAAINSSSQSVKTRFIANNQTVSVDSLSVDKPTLEPDGQEQATFVAKLSDANGNPVSGSMVIWSTDLNQLSTLHNITNDQGESTVTLKGTKAGIARVSASATIGQGKVVPVEFFATKIDLSRSNISLYPQSIVADEKTDATLTVVLKDQFDNPIYQQDKNISFKHNATANDGVSFGAVRGGSPGEYKIAVTGKEEGVKTLTLQLGGGDSGKQVDLGLLADSATAQTQNTQPDKTTAVANGKDEITYTTQLIDSGGNTALPGVSVGWDTTRGNLSAPLSVSDANGQAKIILTSTEAGSAVVTAKVGNNPANTAPLVAFQVGSIAAGTSTVLVTPSSIVANDSERAQIHIYANDAFNNPLEGLMDKVVFSQSGTPVSVSKVTPGKKGEYLATLKGSQIGQATLKVNIDGVALTQQPVITLRADESSARLRGDITLDKKTVTVGESVTYCATLEDGKGNLLGANVPVGWSANVGSQVSQSLVHTDKNGQSCVDLTRNQVGKGVATARIGITDYLAKEEATFTVAILDVAHSSAMLNKTTIVADGHDSAMMRVTLKDRFGNLLPGLSVVAEVVGSAKGVTIESFTEANGEYRGMVKGTKRGDVQLQVRVGTDKIGSELPLKLLADTTTAHINGKITLSQAQIVANGSEQASYRLQVLDANDNPVPQQAVSWYLAAGEDGDYDRVTQTADDGSATLTFSTSKAGIKHMQAQLAGGAAVQAEVLTATPDLVNIANSNFDSDKTLIGSDGTEKARLTVILRDALNNPVPGKKIDLKATPATGLKISALKDNADGSYYADVTSTAKGTYRISATVDKQQLHELSLDVGAITPNLSFDNATHKTIWVRSFTASQPLKNAPAAVKQMWSSSDDSIASVNDVGKVTLHKAGDVQITVQTAGNNSYNPAQASYRLVVDKADPQLKFTNSDPQVLKWGDNTTGLPQAQFSNGDAQSENLTVQWNSSEAKTATVNASGAVTLVKPGVASINIATAENERFKAGSDVYILTLQKAKVAVNFSNGQKLQEKDSVTLQSTDKPLPSDINLKSQWTSSDEKVIKLSGTGGVQQHSTGRAELTLKVLGNDYYEESSGSYAIEIYGAPKIKLTDINFYSLGAKQSGTDWKPYLVDDSFSVAWRSEDNSEYRKPSKVVISLMSDRDIVFDKKEYSNGETGGTATFTAKSHWVGTALKIKVEAYGSYVNNKYTSDEFFNRDYKTAVLEPENIWEPGSMKMKELRVRMTDSSGDQADYNECQSGSQGRRDVRVVWSVDMKPKNNGRSLFKHNLMASVAYARNGESTSWYEIDKLKRDNSDDIRFSGYGDYDEKIRTGCKANHSSEKLSIYFSVAYAGKTFGYRSGMLEWHPSGATQTVTSDRITREN
ncbi:Ig-like domain-containing protein [Serratia quinivorans]|uniref:Ig-like domain-containing protein n=1 Tax=Serratia quinivorans TaxID=137545 RepID=UPI0021BD41AF|nr:Ig-like domain-containing protein [Serratia quinivorans]